VRWRLAAEFTINGRFTPRPETEGCSCRLSTRRPITSLSRSGAGTTNDRWRWLSRRPKRQRPAAKCRSGARTVDAAGHVLAASGNRVEQTTIRPRMPKCWCCAPARHGSAQAPRRLRSLSHPGAVRDVHCRNRICPPARIYFWPPTIRGRRGRAGHACSTRPPLTIKPDIYGALKSGGAAELLRAFFAHRPIVGKALHRNRSRTCGKAPGGYSRSFVSADAALPALESSGWQIPVCRTMVGSSRLTNPRTQRPRKKDSASSSISRRQGSIDGMVPSTMPSRKRVTQSLRVIGPKANPFGGLLRSIMPWLFAARLCSVRHQRAGGTWRLPYRAAAADARRRWNCCCAYSWWT